MKRNAALKQKFIEEAKKIFKKNLRSGFSNWKKTNYSFISPASKEYIYQWLWDSAFHTIVLSHFDLTWAKNEIRNHLLGQWDNGFIPHVVFWGGNTMNLPHWAFIESRLSFRPFTSAITQPPLFPISVEEIFKKDQDKEFLKEVLPKLAKHHKWLLEFRDPDKDFLISIISPNESGMDESPVFQAALGYLKEENLRLRYIHRKADLLNQRYQYNSTVILEKDYFNVEELLFNCVFIESSRSLSRLFKEIGNNKESEYFALVAKNAESVLIKKCWDEQDGIFYTIYSEKERMVKIKTIASILPLFLENLPKEKQKQLISKHLLNPEEFWTKYPVPSVSKDEPFYNPSGPVFVQGKLLWRGPTWINTNWFVVKGLKKHGFDDIADQIVRKMVEMIEKEGFREYFNPQTGQGYRRKDFGWSTLIIDLL